ncbi:kinesin heavy chain, putative [Perkinsus marinus ATCC 50983]|uniref:Kinesin-like protein n=1 Tax=Perkinsus marinus (strain ATCC 50983 / TXsc) TaxID=423536 RepID=C5KRG2_PERM5|nr:kinesin heavy chain, putative [Perkinsus marinus ATCC 50983]EER12935.1 kinesin heavy chain, putative [Perkinsus marinus ATCC 50983]|eukprot:XP_002781140.1 kinesin heavy chain, putative [Perkinsus marinus ATCC 50983]
MDGRKRAIRLDAAFGPTASQDDVYDSSIKDLVHAVLDGYNSCIFAYGPTGSGKTYTVFGSPEGSAHVGLHERIMRDLFSTKGGQGGHHMLISMSMVEIYNEYIYDLLAPEKTVSRKSERRSEGAHASCCQDHVSMARLLQAFQAAVATRRTSSTNINSHSSRSHCVVTLRTSLPCPYTATCRHGKLNLIDLAGSENVGRSGAKGSTLREAQMINKSLSTLVSIVGLTCQSKIHVPYRNSKLTLMLKDSLGGSAKVLMIAHACRCFQSNNREKTSKLNTTVELSFQRSESSAHSEQAHKIIEK